MLWNHCYPIHDALSIYIVYHAVIIHVGVFIYVHHLYRDITITFENVGVLQNICFKLSMFLNVINVLLTIFDKCMQYSSLLHIWEPCFFGTVAHHWWKETSHIKTSTVESWSVWWQK